MRLQLCRGGVGVAGISGPTLGPELLGTGVVGAVGWRLALAAAAVILLASGQQDGLAQGMYPAQGGAYPPQYAEPQDAQRGYGQPKYETPQAYATPQPYPQQGYAQEPGNGQALNAQQLEQLVAPIALYPDTLVAQMLAAATYPAQVANADRWVQAQGNASPYEIAGGADMQNWDPSVKGLTAFPRVLAEMDRNARWTNDLGNAYYNQPQDVLEAVQVMRQRAQSAGNLQSTPQEQVSYNQGAIELLPPNPQTVYVPTYNPWNVYGNPVAPYPGFSLIGVIGSFFNSGLGSSGLQYGLGIAMGAFNHTPFGWLSWGLSWLTNSVLFHHSDYSSRSTSVADWGVRGGGMRAFAGRGAGYGDGRPGYGSFQGFTGTLEHYAPIERPNGGESRAYGRGSMEAYNREPSPIAGQQVFGRPENRLAYGPSYYNGGERGYSAGERGYSAPTQSYRGLATQAYRGPSESFQRGDFGARSSQAFKESKPGGFHLFGGGTNKQPSFKEPKFSQPKMSSGRGSGGHSSFGGGGHSGGGHSSGGKHRG